MCEGRGQRSQNPVGAFNTALCAGFLSCGQSMLELWFWGHRWGSCTSGAAVLTGGGVDGKNKSGNKEHRYHFIEVICEREVRKRAGTRGGEEAREGLFFTWKRLKHVRMRIGKSPSSSQDQTSRRGRWRLLPRSERQKCRDPGRQP